MKAESSVGCSYTVRAGKSIPMSKWTHPQLLWERQIIVGDL